MDVMSIFRYFIGVRFLGDFIVYLSLEYYDGFFILKSDRKSNAEYIEVISQKLKDTLMYI